MSYGDLSGKQGGASFKLNSRSQKRTDIAQPLLAQSGQDKNTLAQNLKRSLQLMTTSTAKLKSNVLMYSDQVTRGTLTVDGEKIQRKAIDE